MTCSQCAGATGLCLRCLHQGAAPASVRAERALILAVLALPATIVGLLAVLRVLPRSVGGLWPLGFLCGIAGLVLSLRELGDISRGASPESGRRMAVVALWVSLVHAGVITLFFLAIFAGGFLQGFSRR